MPMIDEAKLNEFDELMGHYQIVTSELDMGDREWSFPANTTRC